MNIGIIGGGSSGLYAAILIKRKKPSANVFLLEKEEKFGRKLCATGNGHCNLLNKKLSPAAYNRPAFIAAYGKICTYSFLKGILNGIGIEIFEDGDYAYPLNFNAKTYSSFLCEVARQEGVAMLSGSKALDYSIDHGGMINVLLEKPAKIPPFDRLIIASGGKSTPNLGSDGSLYPIMSEHGYSLVEAKPGLAPIMVKDKDVSPLAGLRHEARVEVEIAGEKIFSEEGEILYKEDGLSGIVIFNAESVLARRSIFDGAKIHVDLFPQIAKAELADRLAANQRLNPGIYLLAFLPERLASHILGRAHSSDPIRIADQMKNLVYEAKASYGFANSQVTVGGVSLDEVRSSLESVREKNIYFSGETLDIDGICGGFNLSWALASAFIISEAI